MARPSPPTPSRSTRWVVLSAAVLAITVAAVFWFSRPSVELSDDDYAIALALYRVCNQRSEQGLRDVEAVWGESESSQKDTDSRWAIDSIIADAKSQQWRGAAQACRKILDEQVKH